MAVEWRQPYSEVVAEIGYDAERSEMLVRWTRGRRGISVYSDVSYEEFDRISKSPSVGAALARDIKDTRPHRYL